MYLNEKITFLFSFFLTVFLVSCDNSEKRSVEINSACVELMQTSKFETSKRVDILKSYDIPPVMAQYFNEDFLPTLYKVSDMAKTDSELKEKGINNYNGSEKMRRAIQEFPSCEEYLHSLDKGKESHEAFIQAYRNRMLGQK